MSKAIIVKPNYDATADLIAGAAETIATRAVILARSAIVASTFKLDDPHKYRLLLDGFEVTVKAGTLMRSIDCAADGFTAVVPYNEITSLLTDAFISPPATPLAEVYLGGKKVFTGKLYGRKPSFGPSGRYRTLSGWSFLADALDSVVDPPYEYNMTTLMAYATAVLAPFGISVIWMAGVDLPFTRIKADKDATVGEQLLKLCRQRGVFMMSDENGNAVFHTIAGSIPVAVLKEGIPPFSAGELDMDGRDWFGRYESRGRRPMGNKSATAVDARFPIARKKIVDAPEGSDLDLKTAAEWDARKAFAKGLEMQQDMPGWYTNPGPLGVPWEPNTYVSVISPTLFLPNGFDFLVRSVEYRTSGEEHRAMLSLVSPTAYQTAAVQATQIMSWKARMMLLKAVGTPLEKALMDEA